VVVVFCFDLLYKTCLLAPLSNLRPNGEPLSTHHPRPKTLAPAPPQGGVPKITRSLSSFVRELEHGWQEPTIEPHATPFMTLQPTSMLHPPSQPSLSRQVSVTNPASGSLLSSALYRAPSPSGPSRTPSSGSWDLMLPSLKRTRSGSKLNPSWSEDLGFDALR